MRRSNLFALSLVATVLWGAAPQPALAQARKELGPLCTSLATPADKQIDACNKIIALKVFSGEALATIYFWRGVAWTKKGDYTQVIADTTEALRLWPGQVALYNQRGSAYYDKGEYDIAISDFNDALRLGPPNVTVFHNRGNAYRGKGDYARAIADYDQAIKLDPKVAGAYSYQNRGEAKLALGDLDGALADINEAIRADPTLPTPLTKRGVFWRTKGDYDRAIANSTEAIRLARAKAPANAMTPPGSVLISAYTQRGLSYEAKGDYLHAREDFNAALADVASDAGSKSNQATAKVRLSLLVDATPTAPAPTTTAVSGGHRVALVIGNGAYAHVTKLVNPPNDARAVAKSLRDIGFEVSEGIDLDRDAMQKTTRDFLRTAARAQTALVYYAGHGVQFDGRNYLVPVDVQLKPGGNLTEAMIDMDTSWPV